jgi:hypothetical protein
VGGVSVLTEKRYSVRVVLMVPLPIRPGHPGAMAHIIRQRGNLGSPCAGRKPAGGIGASLGRHARVLLVLRAAAEGAAPLARLVFSEGIKPASSAAGRWWGRCPAIRVPCCRGRNPKAAGAAARARRCGQLFRREVLKIPCAASSVSAVRVIRLTASPPIRFSFRCPP